MAEQGYVNVEGGSIWYETYGNPGKNPLIALHGGPGSSHLSLQRLADLGAHRQVVLYDQLGCGRSDRPNDTSLWSIKRFVRELAALRQALELKQVHILGHSWGTMLLADYLLTKPAGVISATFSSPCLNAHRWVDDARILRQLLPEDIQQTLSTCEANGTTDSVEYRAAEEVFMKQFVCRVEVPDEDKKRRAAAFGKEVYEYMWGPSEFFPTGTLKDYDRTQDLKAIQIPCLFTCGRYDEATPKSTEFYHSMVAGSKFHIFEESSHSPFREQPEEYLRVIDDFLRECE